MDLSEFDNKEKAAATLTKDYVEKMLDSWLQGFQINQPIPLFLEHPQFDPNLECTILTPRNLLIETLVFFGLPKYYMNGEGHWKNWAQQRAEEKRKDAARK